MEFNLDTKNEYVFDEKGNTVLVIREESWNGNDFKMSLRKCYVDNEGNLKPNKGFSFLTEDGPNMLTEELVKRGYGDTTTLVNLLKKREGIEVDEVKNIPIEEDEYFNPEDIFGVGV